MKANKYSVALSLSALAATSAAWAGGVDEHGFYAGLGVGSSKPKISAVAPDTLSKDSDTAYDALLGYKLSKHFAVEGQYTDMGKVTNSSGGTAKGHATSLSAVGMLPVGDKFDLYGKLGYATSKTKTSGFNANGANRSDPTYGAGVQYDFNPMMGVRLGWDHYGLATADTVTGSKNDANGNVTSLNAVFNF